MLETTRLRRGLAVPEDNAGGDPFALFTGPAPVDEVHLIREGVICETEPVGYPEPNGGSPVELVLDATKGFVPLWEKGTVLNWRFNQLALQRYQYPQRVAAEVERLLAEAILLWGDAVPIRFTQSDDAWDFEIKLLTLDNCNDKGCVLASAFFPDGGQHELTIYPKMFAQEPAEQVETLAHEIGHIFGLRHWFAKAAEAAFASELFGEHDAFSIMNYGEKSTMTDADRSDLKTLYALAWSGQLTRINGTPIRLVGPYHTLGRPTAVAVAAAAA